MAFKKNIRNFGKREGRTSAKFLRGVNSISKKRSKI